MSARRQARSSAAAIAVSPNGVPAEIAAGPRVDLWADAKGCPLSSARRNWRHARDEWCRRHGLMAPTGRLDFSRLPPELRDRAPR